MLSLLPLTVLLVAAESMFIEWEAATEAVVNWIYKLAPSRHTKFSEVWISALGATVLIWISELLFLAYTSHFSSFSALYGALGGIVAFRLWIYLSGCIGVFGVCVCAAQAHVREEASHQSDDM